MAEFEIEGKRYRTVPMDTFVALVVARNILPIVTSVFTARGVLAQVLMGFSKGSSPTKPTEGTEIKFDLKKIDAYLTALGPAIDEVVKGIHALPENEFMRIIGTMCAVVSREAGTVGFAPIYSEQAGRLMYDDIRPKHVIRIIREVFEENLKDFF